MNGTTTACCDLVSKRVSGLCMSVCRAQILPARTTATGTTGTRYLQEVVCIAKDITKNKTYIL